MKIISHRGYWLDAAEKNAESAFLRSISLGFGTETDVRDCMRRLVISHDMPHGKEMDFGRLLSIINGATFLLAINIKSDGLAELICEQMKGYSRDNWFVFDMSVPDMRHHLAVGNPVFGRMSEVEQIPAWFDRVEGVWLDSFEGEWFDASLITALLAQGKRVCVVSSELHGRERGGLWSMLRPFARENQVILCTDFPLEASTFFEIGVDV